MSGTGVRRRARLPWMLITSLLLLLALLGAMNHGDERATALSQAYLAPPAPLATEHNAALLFVDFATLPEESPSVETHGFAYIGAEGQSLLSWSAEHADGLERLRGANALRLQRLAEAQQRAGWQCLGTAQCASAGLAPAANLRRALIALDFARARARDDVPSMAAAVTALAEDGAFWNRLAAQADGSLVALMTVAAQRSVWRLAADMAEALPPASRAALGPALLARFDAAPVNWDGAMRGDARRFRFALPGTEPGGSGCADPASMRQCLSWTERLSYQPQATLNLWVELHDALAALRSAAPADLAAAKARYANAHALIEPHDAISLSAHWSYNHAGRERIRFVFHGDGWPKAREVDQERLRLRQRVSAAIDPGLSPLGAGGPASSSPSRIR